MRYETRVKLCSQLWKAAQHPVHHPEFFASFPKRYVKKGKKEIKGRRFLHLVVELPEKNIVLQGKRIRRAAIMLRDEGIRTVVTAEDFPFTKQLWDLGISTVSSYYAYLACASKIANAAAKQMGIPFENSTGVIFANEVTKDVADLAAMLITITKYVKLDCGLRKRETSKKAINGIRRLSASENARPRVFDLFFGAFRTIFTVVKS